MSARKEHVITRVKGDAQPARLVAVSVVAEPIGEPEGVAWQRERLVRWECVGWERSKEGAYRYWVHGDDDVEEFWRAFAWGAKRGGITWLVAMRAVRVASLLNLWGEIDNGIIAWDGRARRDASRTCGDGSLPDVQRADATGGVGARSGGNDGVPVVRTVLRDRGRDVHPAQEGASPVNPSCVIDDPPTVLRLKMPPWPGRLWLHDCRNWGLEPEPEPATARDEACWLADTMRRMVDELAKRGWGGLKSTAGSQALATWRRKFMTHRVVAHDDKRILDIEESAYVGGRCECGRLGSIDGPLYMVDRRSAYAHACASLSVPVRVRRLYERDGGEVCRDHARAGQSLAEVGIDGDEPSYPCAAEVGIHYPVGRRACVLAGPELADAVQRGVVKWVGRVVEYECQPALAAYALEVYGARVEFGGGGGARDGEREGAGGRERDPSGGAAEPSLEAWAKKLLVGLPGKLGQRCAEWISEPELTPPADWYAWWGISRERGVYRYRALGGAVQRQDKRGWTYDAVPAAACWVLSAARLELLRAIRRCGWDHCLYWDTDSLLLDQVGYDALRDAPDLFGQALGQWRLVRTVSRAVIHGVKYYEHDGVVTCAGMPQADCAATRMRDRYWYRQTFGVALLEGHAPEAGRRLRSFTRATQYRLGRIGDGGRVYPHIASEW